MGRPSPEGRVPAPQSGLADRARALAPRGACASAGPHSPIGRPAQPEELAPAYVFLASNADSSYITGTVLQVMGGETSGG